MQLLSYSASKSKIRKEKVSSTMKNDNTIPTIRVRYYSRPLRSVASGTGDMTNYARVILGRDRTQL